MRKQTNHRCDLKIHYHSISRCLFPIWEPGKWLWKKIKKQNKVLYKMYCFTKIIDVCLLFIFKQSNVLLNKTILCMKSLVCFIYFKQKKQQNNVFIESMVLLSKSLIFVCCFNK